MPLAGIVTLIGVFATVVVLAAYLTAITMILKHVNFTLGTIIAGVRSIANQTQPLGSVLGEIVADLTAVEAAVEGLVAKASRAAAAPPQPAPRSVTYEEPPMAPAVVKSRKRKAAPRTRKAKAR